MFWIKILLNGPICGTHERSHTQRFFTIFPPTIQGQFIQQLQLWPQSLDGCKGRYHMMETIRLRFCQLLVYRGVRNTTSAWAKENWQSTKQMGILTTTQKHHPLPLYNIVDMYYNTINQSLLYLINNLSKGIRLISFGVVVWIDIKNVHCWMWRCSVATCATCSVWILNLIPSYLLGRCCMGIWLSIQWHGSQWKGHVSMI